MNIIILTTGISGSSVLTGLLARSGLWVGDETVYKDNITGKYETFENRRLVELNEKLIRTAGISFEGSNRYDSSARKSFSDMAEEVDATPYIEFISECETHAPWIWKDPRLFLTIGFWKEFLDLDNVKFVVIYRNPYELWKSQTNKRIIYSYSHLKNSEEQSRAELINYLDRHDIGFHLIEYDQFVRNPSTHISALNEYCNVDLSIQDWNELYKKPSTYDHYKRAFMAHLIYVKNYRTRIK